MSSFVPALEYTDTPIRIEFDFVPEGDPFNDVFRTNQRTVTTSAGVTQTQFNYNEKTFRVNHTFVTETIKAAYETFYLDHGSLGKAFKYFPSKDEIDFITVTLNRFTFDPRRLYSVNTPGNFEYSFNMSFRLAL